MFSLNAIGLEKKFLNEIVQLQNKIFFRLFDIIKLNSAYCFTISIFIHIFTVEKLKN